MVKLFDNINEDVYKSYVFWSAVLVVKMLVMSVLTGLQRFKKKAFVNPEDIATMPKLKLTTADPDVERVRRAHQNDLENILPYFVIAFFYILHGKKSIPVHMNNFSCCCDSSLNAFASPEDVASISRKLKPINDDPDVERVRRAHRNDLENILPFFVVAFLYLLTGPDPTLATNLIRAAAAGRIVHSFVYAVVVVPQPARLLSYGVTLLVTGFMAVRCILFFV